MYILEKDCEKVIKGTKVTFCCNKCKKPVYEQFNRSDIMKKEINIFSEFYQLEDIRALFKIHNIEEYPTLNRKDEVVSEGRAILYENDINTESILFCGDCVKDFKAELAEFINNKIEKYRRI